MNLVNQTTAGLVYRTGIEDLNYTSFGIIYPLKQNQRSLGISFTLAQQGMLDIFNPDGNIQTVKLEIVIT